MQAVLHRLHTLLGLAVAPLAGCTAPNPYLNVCGNGVVEAANDEECDEGFDGNDDRGACTRSCKAARCGDGLVQEGVEICDAGDLNHDEGPCTRSCTSPRCGDGILQMGEICDWGDLNQTPGYGEGCTTACRYQGRCGDGIVQAPFETCDDGNDDDTDACLSTCVPSRCGDGEVQPPELCDDGNDVDTDACLSTCEPNVCGDGIVHQGVEACDDGNDIDTDACLSTCALNVCGDGFLRDKVEECDDGNLDPDDGCNHLCVRDRLVFITDGMWNAKGIVGWDGAAQECQKIAWAFGDPEPLRFFAWISDGVQSPDTRFIHSKGRYVLPTGQVVADNWEDLTDGTLQHPIDRTRDGKLIVEEPVFTATRPDGTAHPDGHCEGWQVANPMEKARHGASDLTDSGWTEWLSPWSITCADVAHLYCFEAR